MRIILVCKQIRNECVDSVNREFKRLLRKQLLLWGVRVVADLIYQLPVEGI